MAEIRFKHLKIEELHPTFAAEITEVDFSKPISPDVFREIKSAMSKYGVCVFRDTGLDDTGHVEFSRLFGDLDDIKPYLTGGRKPRFAYYELFDAGNLDDTGKLIPVDSPRSHYNKGNGLWHVDSSFNPRRASYSILLAHEIPPVGTGGNTEFADTRTAFDELPKPLKEELLANDYVGAHSLFHSRKLGSPEFFTNINPFDYKMSRHRILQRHEPSSRMNLYLAAHCHHIDGASAEKSAQLLGELMAYATQAKFTISIPWHGPGDMIIWNNTCVMHKASGGSFEGRFRRDMRRTTVHDGSSQAWGLNDPSEVKQGFEVST